MLSVLLLGLLSLGAVSPAPDPPVRIWFDRDEAAYQRGEQVRVFLKSREDRYIVVFQVDPDNRVRILFPLDPDDDNYVRGGRTYKVIDRGGREGFTASVAGRGVVFAAVSPVPFRFEAFTRDGYWDYSVLNATPIEGDVEQALLELTQRMAFGRFDYDILEYGAYADASEIAPGTDLVYEVEPALNGCLGCGPVSTVVVGAAGPMYCATPLYDPMCYDPLYWSPGYVPPYFWNMGWGWNVGYFGGGFYGGGFYGGGYGGGGYYPYAPGDGYRPKPWDRQWSGESPAYRPRVATENVNTVVAPLPSTGRILRANPRRMWDGNVPVAVPNVAPVGARPSGTPSPRARDGNKLPGYTTPERGQSQGEGTKPSKSAPRDRRTSDGKATDEGKAPAAPAPNGGGGRSSSPPKASTNSGGGGSKPSQPSQPSQPSSSGGGRRRG
jgi:hypothetical protein